MSGAQAAFQLDATGRTPGFRRLSVCMRLVPEPLPVPDGIKHSRSVLPPNITSEKETITL